MVYKDEKVLFMATKTLLNDKPEKLINKYYQAIKAAGIPVEEIILFGSYATGKAQFDSDLDVCVVSKKFGKNAFSELVKLSKIASKIEPLIEPHPYHPKALTDPWDPLAHEIRTHGIPVVFKK